MYVMTLTRHIVVILQYKQISNHVIFNYTSIFFLKGHLSLDLQLNYIIQGDFILRSST